jgi:predicted ATPase/class 3 adenylate cyclase
MHNLPTGTVTLLFTDIEGSTRLLQQLGKDYANVLEQCRHLLRTAFQHWRGHEVDTQGDAFFVVFARASDGVSAAVDAQSALARHPWPQGTTVRVRMGLHTGEPSLVSEGYLGLDVHHAARIMSAGHGGQVLLSQTTHDLVEHDLPDRVRLQDLGEHRLKDLQRPSHLYQLVIADLPAHFPPLKTLDSRPHNLPVQPTSLIGREKEVATVKQLLGREDVRLLTLTGPGGIGKTRLGLQVAAELSEHFVDGVFFVNLAPISNPAFVIPTIAQTLGLKEPGDQPLHGLLKAFLRGRQLLLLLDNFEQVVRAALPVAELLAACPKLKIVVTSRMALHLQAEHEFAVPPLALPDPKHLPDVVTLSQYEAVALFILRTQAVKPEFQVSNANARAIAQICARLDGLPLAIELAAARSKLLPPQALLARLGKRLAVLTTGARDAPARQQTLHNTIAWSYDLLAPDEQRLFRRLAVFAGGCTLEAAEAVCNAQGDLEIDVLDAVARLIDNSLLQQEEQVDGEPRVLMLETIREYGLDRLTASGETEAMQWQHATFFLHLAEESFPKMNSAEQPTWLKQLEADHDNLRAVMQWLLEQEGAEQRREMALRLGVALQGFWFNRAYYSEGQLFMERVLGAQEGVVSPTLAKALYVAADLATEKGDLEQAEVLSKKSLALYRELGDRVGIAHCISDLGTVARWRCQYATARSQLEEAAVLFREVGDSWKRGQCFTELARLYTTYGEYERAGALLDESLETYRTLGDQARIGWVLFLQAQLLFLSGGDPATAQSLSEQSLPLLRQGGHIWHSVGPLDVLGQLFLLQGKTTRARELCEESLATVQDLGEKHIYRDVLLLSLARVVARQGDLVVAQQLYRKSLALSRAMGTNDSIAFCLEGLAAVVAAQGEQREAARLWGTAEALREALGAPLPPVYRADYERAVDAARTQLGVKFFAEAMAEGRTTPLEQVITDVLKMKGEAETQ